MVVGNNESTTMKNAGKLLAILVVMAMQRYVAGCMAGWRAHPGLHSKPLDAAIGRVLVPYCPGGRQVDEFE